MDYLLVLGLGVLLGWVCLERPQWITAAWSRVKGWVSGVADG